MIAIAFVLGVACGGWAVAFLARKGMHAAVRLTNNLACDRDWWRAMASLLNARLVGEAPSRIAQLQQDLDAARKAANGAA